MKSESREPIVHDRRQWDRLPIPEPNGLPDGGDEFQLEGRKGPATEETALERHYTVKEVAEMWQLDEKMIRRIFGDEPGVVSIGSDENRFRRAYRTLRIPQSVLVRVHRRLRKAG
jgi:hypothetical protein